MALEDLLSKSPWIEVVVRSIYWKSAFVNKMLAARAKKIQRVPAAQNLPKSKIEFSSVLKAISDLGVKSGGVVVVHSSGSELKPVGLKPFEICEQLLKFVGPNGTLAAPCIPFYAEEPTGLARLTDDICNVRVIYDVKKTPTWTGALSKALMDYPGSIRSRHPLNSMVAVGAESDLMMKDNILDDGSLPCGVNSSWKYCADQGAEIICLGVDMAHSLTMIHVAEDSWENEWPIKDWYRNRPFHVKDGDFSADITVRERRPKWAINYAERTLKRDLIRAGLLRSTRVGSLSIEICNARLLIEFLRKRNAKGYPYYFPFWGS